MQSIASCRSATIIGGAPSVPDIRTCPYYFYHCAGCKELQVNAKTTPYTSPHASYVLLWLRISLQHYQCPMCGAIRIQIRHSLFQPPNNDACNLGNTYALPALGVRGFSRESSVRAVLYVVAILAIPTRDCNALVRFMLHATVTGH